MMSVKNNLRSINSNNKLKVVTSAKAKNTEKLSSGYRVNRAADDAAGLAISEKMRRQIRGLTQASENCQIGIGLCQVRDGALGEVHEILNRMNQLSTQAANGTLSDDDRSMIQVEINALVSEIDRIGSDTKFNEFNVFDYTSGIKTSGTKSSAIGSGYLTDVYTENGKYYPAANLSFGGINAETVSQLYNKSFSFTCSQSCPEAFKFTFINGDGTQDAASNLSGSVQHEYTIDIGGMTSSEEVLDKLFSYVHDHMPNGYTPTSESDLLVSHSNRMIRTSSDTLSIASTTGYNTYDEAAAKFAHTSGSYGKADCSEIASVLSSDGFKPVIAIQAGAEAGQFIYVSMDRMNATLLGLKSTDVSTQSAAGKSITKIKRAFATISEQRANAGAEQNRLEHAIKNLDNVVENTTASESKIRDTDMSEEMVDYSKHTILTQSGQSMLSQANQANQSILSLLQ